MNPRRAFRSDVQHNRKKLLAAATAAFAASGLQTSLDVIARQAGVGIGTLYRHFPTREHLILAAYRHEVEQLCVAATMLPLSLSPDLALRQWMQRFIDYMAAKRGMSEALRSVTLSEDDISSSSGLKKEIVSTLAALLERAVAAGTIRDDMDAEDVFRAMSGICLVSSEQDWQDRARRLLDLMMDGLRYGASTDSIPR
ncbi:TetR/AcrR family transcriptional regulator [Deinococcus sp.]|uniref:TetR/AcrR family transcriptional regulator n=1 Tax=Deinococcus sp. TaxID=47478 RepID=UPI003CC68183